MFTSFFYYCELPVVFILSGKAHARMLFKFDIDNQCQMKITLPTVQWSLRYETAPSADTKRSLVGVRSHVGVWSRLKRTL